MRGRIAASFVTTRFLGPDSYQAAFDKPIKLIDGGNLLYIRKGQRYVF